MTVKDKPHEQATSPVDKTASSKTGSSLQNPLLSLRRLAEKFLRERKIWPPKQQETLSAGETQHIIHELHLHQIELEMQNDELRRTQVELEFERARYFDLYDLAPVGYCTVSEKGLILEANVTAANLLGVARGSCSNQPFSRFILNEDQDIFYLIRKQLFETGEAQSGELRLIRQDKTFFWVHLEASIGLDARGRSLCRIGLSNISKRKRAEEALLKSHHKNQVILDSITDAFISLSDEMVVSYFNAAAEKMLDRKRIDVIGQKLFDVFPEAKGSIFEENYTKAIRTKSPMAFEAEFNVAPYENWYEVRVYPSLEGITVYFRIITERKNAEKAESKLRLVKRQLHKAESLELMAGSIAHLFNNQLQVALANLEVALDELAADAVQRKYLINAIQANRRSSDVTGLLLTYLGQNIGKTESLDLSEICQQSLSEIGAAIPSGINIETNLISPGPVVCANASQIQQIFTIFITNAWEAIGDCTGVVSVEVKTLAASNLPSIHFSHIDQTSISGYVACLEVKDTGCGIPTETMDRIFDPFYSTKLTGRGLGLAVAMSLVRAWGGMIYVNSVVNEGSCFRACLPLAVDVFPRQAALITKQKTFKTEGAVLIVDDDPVLCDVMEAVLKLLGFSVFVATSGKEAVALFQKHCDSIVCLLTDLSMPGMNGWDTLAALRKIKPGLPAILSSGYDEAHAMDGDYKELPQAFLHKPYTREDLKNILKQVLGDATESDN